ncbi:MAG: hypothetical protein DPW09_45515 [Anaerolineae bacterium]|nr:hypothetical protein [Anaerolineae bacterium]
MCSLAVQAQWPNKLQQATIQLNETGSIIEQIGLPGELWPLYAALDETPKAARVVKSHAEKMGQERLREGFPSAELGQRVISEAEG